MAEQKGSKLTRYQKQQKGKQGQSAVRLQGQLERRAVGSKENQDRAKQRMEGDKIDELFGFSRMKEGLPRVGWLLNYLPITMPDETGIEKSGLDLYFIDREGGEGGGNFKATVFYEPYFLVDVADPRRVMEVANHLLRKFEGCKAVQVEREDLDLPNHLSGKRHPFLKVSFGTVTELMDAKSALRPIITQNQKRFASSEDYFLGGDSSFGAAAAGHAGADIWGDGAVGGAMGAGPGAGAGAAGPAAAAAAADPLAYVLDLREYDVPYTVRASIDLDLRVGAWYSVTPEYGSESCEVLWMKDLLQLCEPRVLAFDIECEKSPLKFPNPEVDRIFMISYMVNGQGYLIINREVVSEDIEDFEYTPKPNFPGPFQVFNEPTEEALLRKFVAHVQELRPHVIVTYNGDKFDWPYVETRCSKFPYLSIYNSLGIKNNAPKRTDGVMEGEYVGRCVVHLDAFCWVQRDSYLPQGNQGLKAVTKHKLGYDPVEVDPEDMLRFARERPHHMASYSVSDAVATYYLYTTYVHNFIFSLSTIIPMAGEDVLRKGSGTLCEALLMVEAYKCNIVCPNKQTDALESFHEGHLLESETYIGGHVECLEAGVFRADIPAKFSLVPSALQQLIDNIDRDLTFTLEVEHGVERSEVLNYDEVRQAIVERLEMLRDSPVREEFPIIYHLDVAAMYPNIILTNRLQPSAMVSTSDCAACVFNRAENHCKRPMSWTWRGDYSPAGMSEFHAIRRQLTYERFAPAEGGDKGSSGGMRTFSELSEREQAAITKARLKAYSHRVYRKTKVTTVEQRVNTVCMRENSFYVDTVKAFRDRRYDYKLLTKEWKGKKNAAIKSGDAVARKEAEDREVLMDSLQLAHKCILNSFYGYVMRKGARWRSMEMAGIVTHTGAQLIKQARELVEQVGRPLELDTDGIWCILPSSFPQDFKFKTKGGGKVNVGYPCAMLNADVHERYTNHQYQTLMESKAAGGELGGTAGPVGAKRYTTHSECSIFFELDGPYKAMILPASPEEGKLLKKKYVVFNFNGSIAELKGFELKRRGELELVKIFQSQVFEHFLAGRSLEECYRAVGAIGNQWLDVLDEQGNSMQDDELLELISERKTISKTVEDYEGRKSTSLTTAARLADFLGAEMVKDKGLNCNLIISRLPAGAPVTERALPVAIFSCEPAIRKYFLRKWLRDSSLDCEDFRDVVDWDYYKDRLGKSIQKIVTIPAGMQRVANPCPRVEHPVWLQRAITERASGKKQLSIMDSLSKMRIASPAKEGKGGRAQQGQDGDQGAADSSETVAPGLLSKPLTGILTTGAGAGSSAGSGSGKSKKRVRIQLLDEVVDFEAMEREAAAADAASKGLSSPAQQPAIGDLEDIGSNRVAAAALAALGPRVSKFNSPGQEQQTVVEDSSGVKEGGVSSASTEASLSEGVRVLALNEHPPESEEQLQAWLRRRKDQWKTQRLARRQRKAQLMGGSVGVGGSSSAALQPYKRSVGVMDFVRNASLAATHGFWQVLELQETDAPGEFVVWAITAQAQLQRLNVTIPRRLYANIHHSGREAQALARELGGVPVQRDLPHGKRCRELFELEMAERKFQRNERQVHLFLCDAHVEGVYESQVPLWLRGVLKMGCVAKVGQQALTEQSRSGFGTATFKLRDMDLVNVNSHPYLSAQVASYRRIFLYFAADKTRSSGDLGILGAFIIDASNVEELEAHQKLIKQQLDAAAAAGVGVDRNAEKAALADSASSVLSGVPASAKAYVWLINSRTSGALDSRPPLQRIFRKFHRPNNNDSSSVVGDDGQGANAEVKFTQTFVPSIADAWQQCSERLVQYERERHGPTIVVVQGGQSSDRGGGDPSSSGLSVGMDGKQWRHAIPALKDFPVAVMPAHSSDQLFPAVGWQMFAAERMVQRYIIFPRWFADRLCCARYAHVPVCNLGPDALTTMIDVAFSRQLAHNRHLLWACEGSRTPDLGKGADSEQELLDVWCEALSEPVINSEGVYRDVCVELDLYGLAVCAIMSSGELDAEGLTALTMTSGGKAAASAQAAGSSAARAGRKGGEDDDSDDEEGGGKPAEGLDESAGAGDAFGSTDNTSDASCARAFNIFKAVLAKCIDEISSKMGAGSSSDPGAGIADSVLTGVYRYLCGYGNGLLADPLLHRVVYSLMTKLFQKLVGGLCRLGTRVVHADFSRIIISTNKFDYPSAMEYVEFILAAISSKSTFSFLQVTVKSVWEQMCWLGPENWSGIPLLPPTVALESVDDALGLHGEDVEDQYHDEDADNRSEAINASYSNSDKSELPPYRPAPVTSIKLKGSPFRSPQGVADLDQEVGGGGQREEEGEFDFLDDISGRSGEVNLASIKSRFLAPRGRGAREPWLENEEDEEGEDSDGNANEYVDEEDGYYGDDGFASPQQRSRMVSGLEAEQEEQEEDPQALHANWNLATYFPPAAAQYFHFIVGEFMQQYKSKRDQLLLLRAQQLHHMDGGNENFGAGFGVEADDESQRESVVSAALVDEGSIAEAVSAYMKRLIEQRFTGKMLEIVDDLQQLAHAHISSSAAAAAHHPHQQGQEDALGAGTNYGLFPMRAGSHLQLTSPALEFVKATTHVMMLDPQLRHEVAALRRLLLTQLKVREFSPDSAFRDPCLSYVLRDVICSYCSTCRDLDLLRDASLTAEDDARRWRCSHCGNRINTEEVENRLLEAVDKLTAAYLLQDFRCSKTHRVARRQGSSVSDLCEPLRMDLPRSDALAQLRVLRRVARFHHFDMLQNAVEDFGGDSVTVAP